ncbi:unnamed protein product [Schistosoma mattheei]|uniref:Uncharacterized protein n=1 Tax=Schistosoma mattheei TaxID=31246 RepID=A0AA85B137_9TREM|nr:unnamed protein product [Schistosoma mattheei]
MTKTLSLILQPFSILFISLALIINHWNCGGLFTSCLRNYQTTSILLILFFFLGIVLLTIAFILDLITICSESLDSNASYSTIRFIILICGLMNILLAILIYSLQIDRQFSRLLCTIGIVFTIQVALLNLLFSSCIHRNHHSEPIVH